MKLFTALFVFLTISITSTANANSLKIGISQYPLNLHPGIDSMAAKSYVLGFAYRPLTIFDADWQRQCMACDTLPSLDNGLAQVITLPNGTQTIRAQFTLRDDFFWGDGTAVTTRDVLFAWKVGKHTSVGIANYELYTETIADLTVLDDKTFTVTYDKVNCDFSDLTDFAILPQHIEGPIFERNPDEYRNQTAYNTNPTLPGLYNGPYIMTKREIGQAFTFAPNPHWQGTAPAIKDIQIKIIENTTALSAQLLSGGIDMIAGELGINVDQAIGLEQRLQRSKKHAIRYESKPGLIYEHIELNLDNPHLADLRIRKALLLGLDRESMVNTLFGGKQQIAHTNIHPLDSVYTADITTMPYDQNRAKTLLEQAGCIAQPKGPRICANGAPLRFTFRTTAGNLSRERVQQLIQSQWAQIGVEAIIKNETPRILFGDTLQKRDFDGAVMFAWLSAPRNIPKTTLHSDMIPAQENGWSGQNFSGHDQQEIDNLLNAMETTCEPEENQALWDELQSYYADNLPAIPLYFRAETHFVPTALQGHQPTGHQFPSSLWSQNWSLSQN